MTITIGENKLLERPVLASDGVTPFPVASLTSAKVELSCTGKTPVVLVLGVDEELRESESSASTLVLELITALTRSLGTGSLRETWTLERANASFSAGIAISTVTGSADADATAVGAGDLIIDLFYA